MGSDGATGASPIRVALDVMGGDHGPPETVKGALEALESHDIELLLVGDGDAVQAELAKHDLAGKPVKVVPSVDRIGDDEHPLHALRAKPKASILVATGLLKSGDADVLVSMGPTGASMASAVLVLGMMEGLERPCIGGPFLGMGPGMGPRTVLVDMGTNIDCRPALLVSFAALGAVFARSFLDIDNPRIGLLSVGAEEAKGNRQVQECFQLLQDSHLNFIGNVEGMDFFTGRADVIVCDGFVGNILMKFTEGLGAALGPFLEERLSSILAPEELDRVTSDIWRATNQPRIMGGPLWGVNGAVVLGHGSCKAGEVAGAIDTAVRYVEIGLVESMRQELLVVAGQNSASKLKADS